MHNLFQYSLLVSGLLLTAHSQAEEAFRQHDAHVHGHVEFNIAQDLNELLVEITAPGADVVGFEHAPENKQQKKKLADAVKTLNHADQVLLLSSAAGCKIEYKSVVHTLSEGDDHSAHAGHAHDSHEEHDHTAHSEHDNEHHEGHDNETHEEHDHDSHKGHDHETHNHSGQHGGFTVEYHFECQDISKLKSINTLWFKHFPATEEISVNLLTDTAQLATELSTDKHSIKL